MTVLIPFAEAFDDPQLFGPHPPSFDRFRTLARVMDGLPLTAEQLDYFRRCTGRTVAPTVPARETWAIAKRRDGKTRGLGARMAWRATCVDYSPFLARGEWGHSICVAGDRRQGRTLFDYIRGYIFGSPVLRQLVTAETRETIELGERRVRIEVRPPNHRSIRSPTVVDAGLDETGTWRNEEDSSASPDTAVLAAIRPSMATIPTSTLTAIGTPWAKRGEQWRAKERYWGVADPRVLVWWARGPELALNPCVDQQIIVDAFDRDAAAARSEWHSEWRNDLESFIGIDELRLNVVPGRVELPPAPGIAYGGAIDSASGAIGGDDYAGCVWHLTPSQTFVVDKLIRIRPPFDPHVATEQIAAAMRPYGVGSVVSDRYAAEWLVQSLRRHGLGYTAAPLDRSAAYVSCLPWLTGRRCELPDHPTLLTQFANLERRTAGSGKDSIDHPRGAHDDLSNVVALAIATATRQDPTRPRTARVVFGGSGPRTEHEFVPSPDNYR